MPELSGRTIGMGLGLNAGTLEAVAITQRDNPDACLREMLTVWLRGSSSVEHTWGTIVDALRQPSVGMGQLAYEIETVHHVGPPPKGGRFAHQGDKFNSMALSLMPK